MNSSENYIGTPCGIVACVDYYQNAIVKGRLFHRYQKKAIHFERMTEAIFKMDEFFDRLGYPFRGNESHYFRRPKKQEQIIMERKVSDEEMLKNRGEKGTFIIKVEQRQHSSWQGRVTWVEEGKTENFRSTLELLKMIDGALDDKTEATQNQEKSDHKLCKEVE